MLLNDVLLEFKFVAEAISSPSKSLEEVFMHETVLSCIFQVHSALIVRVAVLNCAIIRHGSRPLRVARHFTVSIPILAFAKVRSIRSESVRILLCFGAGTDKNCSIAYCFSVSTPEEKRLTCASLI